MSTSETSAPSCANLCAMAWPIPLAAPVTIAALPSSRQPLDCFWSFIRARPILSATRPSAFLPANAVRKRPDLFNGYAHLITIFQPERRILRHANSARVSRENHGAWKQRRTLAEKRDQGRHVVNHIPRVGVLKDPPIHQRLNLQLGGIGDGIRGYQARAERGKGVEALPAAPLGSTPSELPIACADVIPARITATCASACSRATSLHGFPITTTNSPS